MLADLYTILESFNAYPNNLPQDAEFPAMVYSLSANRQATNLSGDPVGTASVDLLIEILSLDHAEADAIAADLKAKLDGIRGGAGSIFGLWTIKSDSSKSVRFASQWLYVRRQTYSIRAVSSTSEQAELSQTPSVALLPNVYRFLSSVSPVNPCPENIEEDAEFPALIYSLIDAEYDHTLNGKPIGIQTASIDLEILSFDHQEVDSISKTIQTALNGYKGRMGRLFGIWKLQDDSEDAFPYGDGSGQFLYSRTLSYSVRWLVPIRVQFSSAFDASFF